MLYEVITKFIEVIIAPKVEDDALKYLQFHKNLRVLEYDISLLPQEKDLRFINGTLLSQTPDNKLYEKLESVTEKEFDIDKNKKIIDRITSYNVCYTKLLRV